MMTDSDLFYDALLRTERRLEAIANDGNFPLAAELARPAFIAIQILREEMGSALLKERR